MLPRPDIFRSPRRSFGPIVALTMSLLLLGLASLPVLAQGRRQSRSQPGPQAVHEAVHSWRLGHEAEILAEYREFLRLPDVASDEVNIRHNAEHILAMLDRRGIAGRLLETPGAPPAVYARVDAAGAERTIVFYAHYDGQPVDHSRWHSDPWEPVLRDGSLAEGARDVPFPDPATAAASGARPVPLDPEWRIYARAASDDKAPIMALLSAWDALAAAGLERSVNVVFFFEGEEEAGSPHVRTTLEHYRDLLAADAWLFCDGPVNQSRRAEVNFGVRGIVGVQMTVYGPARALHSGHYGNWAPHPTVELIHLLASMRDEEGTVLVGGFYDTVRPVTDTERAAIARIPPVEEQLITELALGRTEGGGARLPERIMAPAMNVSGFAAGGVGAEAKNAIPSEARAYVDFRLVPELVPERVRELVEAHVRGMGFEIVHAEPSLEERRAQRKIIRLDWGEGYPAVRTSMELPVSRALIATAREVAPDLLTVPTHGGSLPMYVFQDVLGVPLITLPIVNHDNNQHGPDENLRLQNLWDGIAMFGQVLARLGDNWEREIP